MPVEVGTQVMSEVGEKKAGRVGYSYGDKIGQTERQRQPNSESNLGRIITAAPRPASPKPRRYNMVPPSLRAQTLYSTCGLHSPEVVRGRHPWRHSNFSALSIMDHLTLPVHAPPGFDSQRARPPI